MASYSSLPASTSQHIFQISPLIRITILSFYLALTVPLPFLAKVTAASIPPIILWVGVGIGFIFLYGVLSEKVIFNEEKIQSAYPVWFPHFFRKGRSLAWDEIQELKMRTTGQGGLVYYFVTPTRDKAYLLPMRVAGFTKMVDLVTQKTGIDTTNVALLKQGKIAEKC